jgi:Family of unknown function (DUF6152)
MRLQKIFGISILVLVIVFGLSAGIASAHHSNAEYTNKLTKMEGTVVEYRWRNPHVTVVWDSKDETGKVVRWRGELASITTVMGSGLTKDSLKPGQVVKMSVYPSKLGTPESVVQYIERQDGTVVLGWSNQAGGNEELRLAREKRQSEATATKP